MALGQSTSDIANVEIEVVSESLPELLKDETTLVGFIGDNGRSTRVGVGALGTAAGAFRQALKVARPSHYEFGSLDGGALPQGKGDTYDKIYTVPKTVFQPIGFTKLAELTGTKDKKLAITNIVIDTTADAAKQAKQIRNQLLNAGDGTGKLGLVSSADTVNKVVTMQNSSFGARLINQGQKVTFWSGTDLLGTATVSYVFNQLGIVQKFVYTGWVGTNAHAEAEINVAGIIVRPKGLTDGAPVGIHGLSYVNNTAQTGDYFGITRASAPWIVAPGIDLSGAQVSLPIFDLMIQEVKSRKGGNAINGQSWHTHGSQVSSYKELGYERTIVNAADVPKGMDLLYSGKLKVADLPVLEDGDADQTAWDLVHPKAWGRVTYGDGPFWYEIPGIGKLYPLYDSTGSPLTEFGSCFVDASDYYCDDPLLGGRISSCKVPALNAV